MDIVEAGYHAQGFQVQYKTFEDLRVYCYRVASVVGLVCIRIFGYQDLKAEKLAEQLGLAFQLTNIVRDVKEDLSLGRVYLPDEDLAKFDLKAEQLQIFSRFIQSAPGSGGRSRPCAGTLPLRRCLAATDR